MSLEIHIDISSMFISPISYISYCMEQVTFTHYISRYPYFYGLTGFSITYPHSLALRGTLALHECVVSLTLPMLHPWGKCWVSTEQEVGWASNLAWNLCRGEKSLDPARNLTSITHSPIQSTAYQPHQLHYYSYPFTVSLTLNVRDILVTDCFYNSHFLFRKKRI
jgi:hypothetical protein